MQVDVQLFLLEASQKPIMDPYRGNGSIPALSGLDRLSPLLQLLQHTDVSTSNSQSLFAPSVSTHNLSSLGTLGAISPDVLHLLAALQQLVQQPASHSTGTTHPPPASAQHAASTLDVFAGTLPDDEEILVNILSARALRGWSVRQSLEALHGVWLHVLATQTILLMY